MKESSYLEGQVQVIDKIKNLPIFKPYNDAEVKSLLRLSKIRMYKPNEIIIYENADDKWMYFLISGSVQVEKQNKVLSEINEIGDFFGELGFIDEDPRSASVRAVKDSVCLAVDMAYLLKIKEDGHDSFHASIYMMLSKILAHRLRQTNIKYIETKKELDRLKKMYGS